MASIQKRGGVYQAHVKVWDAQKNDWRWTSRSCRTGDREQAERVAAQLQEVAHLARTEPSTMMLHRHAIEAVNAILRISGRDPLPSIPPVGAFAERWLSVREGSGVRPATVQIYRSHLQSFRSYFGDNHPIDEIRAAHLEKWHAATAANRTESTASNQLKTVKRMFDLATKEGLVRANPAALVSVRASSAPKLTREPFSREEIASIVRHCRETQNREALWLTLAGLCLGARIRDCAGLRVGDFRPVGAGLLVSFTPAKTIRGGKAITLPVLEPFLSLARDEIAGREPGEVVFPDLGAERDTSSLSRVFIGVCEELGIEGSAVEELGAGKRWRRKSHHSLRLTLNTWLQADGVDRESRKDILGHATDKAHDAYTRPQVEMLAAHMKKALAG